MGLLGGLIKKLFGARLIWGSAESDITRPYNREIYEQVVVRSIIDCIATHCAKAEAMHVVLDKDGRIKEIKRDSVYAKLLNETPNSLQCGYEFRYRLATRYHERTTAFVYIRWKGTKPDAIILIDERTAEVNALIGGGYAVTFTDADGVEMTINAEDMIVLRKFDSASEMFGGGNEPVRDTLTMLKAADEGLTEALSVSNKVRVLLKQKMAMLDSEDVDADTAKFQKRFKEAAKNGGVVGVDASTDVVPLNVTAWSANVAQTKETRENLYRYWHVSEKFLTSSYTSTEWQSTYEAVIEPYLMYTSRAVTNAFFTPRERENGERLIFSTDTLMYLSTTAKVSLISATRDMGLMTINEYRAIFGLSPVEDGDERMVSLNYIKAKDQSKYQLGGENTDGSLPSDENEGDEESEAEGDEEE